MRIVVHLILLILTRGVHCDDGRNLMVGGGINVFKFFGDLSVRLRLDPRDDPDSTWLLRESPTPVFETDNPPNMYADMEEMVGSFKVELCDDLTRLLAAMYRGLKVEGVDRSWEAVTRAWSRRATAAKLGLEQAYVGPGYGYVLVRVSRHLEEASLPPGASLHPRAAAAVAALRPGGTHAALRFIAKFGTHYVSSYVVGNSLYQVLVYSRENFGELKRKMLRKDASGFDFVTGVYAEHVGKIVSSCGSEEASNWARKALTSPNSLWPGPLLLNLRTRPYLLPELRSRLGANVLLSLALKKVDKAIEDPETRRFFDEILDNRLRLYDMNA